MTLVLTPHRLPGRRCGLSRREEHDHRPAFEVRGLIQRCLVPKLLRHALEQALAEFLVRDLSPAEEHRDSDLGTIFQELLRLAHLRLKVVRVDSRAHPDFLELDGTLALAGLALATALLVPVLAVVHQPADWWNRVGLHLDEVKTALARYLQGFARPNDANLGPVLVDQAHLGNPDALVDANWPRRADGSLLILRTVNTELATIVARPRRILSQASALVNRA